MGRNSMPHDNLNFKAEFKKSYSYSSKAIIKPLIDQKSEDVNDTI